MNQTILSLTDFSNNSLIATRYSLELARKMQARVHILHAYQPFTSAFQSSSANQKDEQQAKINAEKELSEFIDKLGTNLNIPVTSSVTRNNLVEAVNHYIQKENICLVVMGAHGVSGARLDLLGNNTYDVARDVSRPLLIVPEQTSSFKLENIVFFTDYQQGDIKSLKSFDELFGGVLASCTLVHIHEGKDTPTDDDLLTLTQWKTTLEKEVGINSLSAEIMHVPENIESINQISSRLKADMILITLIDSRPFFEKLLHKSLAKAIILNAQTPVLLTSEDTE